jgi:hypothetical protein
MITFFITFSQVFFFCKKIKSIKHLHKVHKLDGNSNKITFLPHFHLPSKLRDHIIQTFLK